MIRPITKLGNPVLEMPAEPVTAFDSDLAELVEDLFESMYASHGAGLAAPQVGISKRIAVIDVSVDEAPRATIALVNPEIIHTEGRETLKEGCLSIPGFYESVTRPSTVAVRAQDAHGSWFECTGDGLLARALLHETDHLDGRLFLSHISALKRGLVKRRVKKLIEAGRW